MPPKPSAYSKLPESDRLAVDTAIALTYKTSRERVMFNPAKASSVDLMRVMAMEAFIQNSVLPPAAIAQLISADIAIRREQIAQTLPLLKESRAKLMQAQVDQSLLPDEVANFIFQTPFVAMHQFVDPAKRKQPFALPGEDIPVKTDRAANG